MLARFLWRVLPIYYLITAARYAIQHSSRFFTKINMYSMPVWSIVRLNTCTYGIMVFMVNIIRVHEKNTDAANLFIINNPLVLELFKRSFSTLQNLKLTNKWYESKQNEINNTMARLQTQPTPKC